MDLAFHPTGGIATITHQVELADTLPHRVVHRRPNILRPDNVQRVTAQPKAGGKVQPGYVDRRRSPIDDLEVEKPEALSNHPFVCHQVQTRRLTTLCRRDRESIVPNVSDQGRSVYTAVVLWHRRINGIRLREKGAKEPIPPRRWRRDHRRGRSGQTHGLNNAIIHGEPSLEIVSLRQDVLFWTRETADALPRLGLAP